MNSFCNLPVFVTLKEPKFSDIVRAFIWEPSFNRQNLEIVLLTKNKIHYVDCKKKATQSSQVVTVEPTRILQFYKTNANQINFLHWDESDSAIKPFGEGPKVANTHSKLMPKLHVFCQNPKIRVLVDGMNHVLLIYPNSTDRIEFEACRHGLKQIDGVAFIQELPEKEVRLVMIFW